MFPLFLQPSGVSKPKTEDEATEPQELNLLECMIEALHMELLFVRHRIAIKLINLGQGNDLLNSFTYRPNQSGCMYNNHPRRLSTIENFEPTTLKVVAATYERWSLMRASNYY